MGCGLNHAWLSQELSTLLVIFFNVAVLQDFASVEEAEDVFEAGMDDPFTLEGELLRLDYSHNPPPVAAQGHTDQGPSDWICDMCQQVNFSRSFFKAACGLPTISSLWEDARSHLITPDGLAWKEYWTIPDHTLRHPV